VHFDKGFLEPARGLEPLGMLITIQFKANIDLLSFQVVSRKLPCIVSLILIRYYDFVLSSLAL